LSGAVSSGDSLRFSPAAAIEMTEGPNMVLSVLR
jgi:hypothetical protein